MKLKFGKWCKVASIHCSFSASSADGLSLAPLGQMEPFQNPIQNLERSAGSPKSQKPRHAKTNRARSVGHQRSANMTHVRVPVCGMSLGSRYLGLRFSVWGLGLGFRVSGSGGGVCGRLVDVGF